MYYNPYNSMYTQFSTAPVSQPNYGSTMQMQQQSMQQVQQPSYQGLNGKIVDNEDVVKITEVPMGGYGIFPKADLSEIYIKSWNNNGTTSITTFRPSFVEPTSQSNTEANNVLLQKIEALENKIDMFLKQPIQQIPAQNNMSGTTQQNKSLYNAKEVEKKLEVQPNGF